MLADLLIHEVQVFRRSGKRDRFGQQVDVNPSQIDISTPTATYPCRLSNPRGGLVMQERAVDVFEVRYVIFTATGVDLNEDDSVRVIDPRTDYELLPISKIALKKVVSDGTGVHHLEYEVWSQAGPRQ